jgi:hypothetical protein
LDLCGFKDWIIKTRVDRVSHGWVDGFCMDGIFIAWIDGFAWMGSMVLHGWINGFCMDRINVFHGRLDGNEGFF